MAASSVGVDPDAAAGGSEDHRSMGSAVTTPEPPRIGGDSAPGTALVAIVGSRQQTNIELVSAWRERGVPAILLSPWEAKALLGPGDVAIGRLDVLPTLDGIEGGLELLDEVAWAVSLLLAPEASGLHGSTLSLDLGRRRGIG